MMEEKNLETVMQLIIHSGNAKSYAMEAIHVVKEGKKELAFEKLKEAEKTIVEAHRYQTEMLTKEASGEKTDVSLLVVHSQDHLMTAMNFIELAKEIVTLYDKLD
ncbi:PTS lactose/cellobiose transporter subunit IIA [Staphylococcus delphini]|uniref:PTS lactose/cellobiose transporter subunit IIA n=2 Tax=Staphylococcus delphini TaxID=53344 RepID=A0AAQ0D5B8_9STAP|nr:PTS lactose/cellobiose transporter subunit IIA [Staphylococcus delphini]MDE9752698.1 PTS lactose/cellobiose transporter subunit IIA [Staphylococcus delphini]MDE9789850.1 PTS lactose/cellobiose transporter subunit IIA [Staphylococcus delphini]MDE9792168.1 PTS lactose/cellobiose transporter subunit IIA [Staphylococcus delphini]MDE9794677.1 PTS lactose/cellobiose transporter subunit IIA [Staphylococcus delphini]MDE9796151.1 PTS lactose/cellobiose transporter subunit IIA [Staphylococcus delphin